MQLLLTLLSNLKSYVHVSSIKKGQYSPGIAIFKQTFRCRAYLGVVVVVTLTRVSPSKMESLTPSVNCRKKKTNASFTFDIS